MLIEGHRDFSTLVHSFGSMNLSVCHEVHIYI